MRARLLPRFTLRPLSRRLALPVGLALLACGGSARAQTHDHAGHDAAAHDHSTTTDAPAHDHGTRDAGTADAAMPSGLVAADTVRRTPAELEALYWQRINGGRTRFTDADVTFMTGMIGHHAQALVMAAMAPTHGASPEVARLALRIDNAQNDEIATMQAWLRNRSQPVPEVHIQGTTLMIHGGGDHAAMHHSMPGMLTEAQMAELDAARDGTFDRLFLTYMIQHHTGAVTMVDELFASDGAAQDEESFKLASDVQVDQRTEIARMHLMLDALPATR